MQHKYNQLIRADFSCTRSMPLTSRTVSRRRSVTSRRRRNDRQRRRNSDKRHSKIYSLPSNDHLLVLLELCFNHPPLPCHLCPSSDDQVTIAEILCNAFRDLLSKGSQCQFQAQNLKQGVEVIAQILAFCLAVRFKLAVLSLHWTGCVTCLIVFH